MSLLSAWSISLESTFKRTVHAKDILLMSKLLNQYFLCLWASPSGAAYAPRHTTTPVCDPAVHDIWWRTIWHNKVNPFSFVVLITSYCVRSSTADDFQGLSKAFHYPIKLITFICFFEITFKNAYWYPPQNSLLCDWSMSTSANLSLASGTMRKN